MARRFATSFMQTGVKEADTALTWWGDLASLGEISGAAGGITFVSGADGDRQYIAPACYSEVRKVVFWACIRHAYTGAESAIPVRLRVMPSSSSNATRILESGNLPESLLKVTSNPAFSPSMWTVSGTPTNEASFYGAKTSGENAITTIQFPLAGNTSGSQLIYREFDRFDPQDADFFNDWDSIAANGSPDEFIAYRLGIQRTDGNDWVTGATNSPNFPPGMVACGFAVVQAPSANNRTRIYVPASFAWFDTVLPGSTFFGRRGGFKYVAADWSGVMELRVVSWQEDADAITTGGRFKVSVVEVDSLVERYQESFDSGGAKIGGMWKGRSANFLANVVDGDYLAVERASVDGSTVQGIISYFEITLENFNTFTTFFSGGAPPPTPQTIPGGSPPPSVFGQPSGLFDPLWFQDMEGYRFLSSNFGANVIHGGILTPQIELALNANLATNVNVSAFNAPIRPELNGQNTLYAPITQNDPINLAGKRKITAYYDGQGWETGDEDFPGPAYISYVVAVPNTETVELGPLFDVGAFDAEGCAATSAGLGEPPVLVITNGSTIPQKFNPTAAGTDGEVEDAGIPVPFEGETPQAVPGDAAASPDGGLDLGTYRYRYTFRNCCTGKESDPNPEDIVVDTSGQSPAAQVTFSFAGVRIPSDPQICEICLYRTVEGGDFPIMAKVGCFNIDDTTIFVDDMSDDALDFLNNSLSILNAPMPCVPIVVDFRNRLFGMGDIPNLATEGTVSVVNGSDIVVGDGEVDWNRCLEGKFIRIGSDCRSYEILRVMPPEEGQSPPIGRLKLVDVYEGSTDTGLTYEICGRPNRLYYSEPLEPEYWPAANFLDVEPGDGDRLMGAVSNFDRLVICKRRKTYVLTFRENPGIEVIVPSRISSDIGCIGPRTFAQVESGSVWLADRGLALYDGRTVMHVPESQNMNDIFTNPDNPNYVRRDRNGRVIEAVGIFSSTREQYLLLLPTVQTNRGCNLMLVWDVKLRNITLLKFCQEFLSMVEAKDAQGNSRVYLGDTNGFVWIYDIGDCDGVGFPNATGTVRGTVTFAGIDTTTGASVLDDSSATFIEGGIPGLADLSGVAGLSGSFGGGDMGLAGACVYTRRRGADYDEPWVQRTIYAATNERLYVTPQWGPDTPFDPTGQVTFEYMIGPIELDLLFKPQNYGTDDMSKRDWRQIVVHEVEQFASQLRIDLLPDFSSVDPEADTVVDPVTEETGEGRVFRMDYAKGRQVKPVGRHVHFYMALRMRNFAPEEPIRVINHLLGVEPRVSK
jgi:hypothetical protein